MSRPPSHRRVKKMIKANLRKNSVRRRIKILRTVGKAYVIPAVKTSNNYNIACIRYWDYVIVAEGHEKFDKILNRPPYRRMNEDYYREREKRNK